MAINRDGEIIFVDPDKTMPITPRKIAEVMADKRMRQLVVTPLFAARGNF